MRRTFAWALAVSMAGSLLAGCAGAPGLSPGAGRPLQIQGAQQDIALAAINRAATALQTAQSAAQITDFSGAIRYLKDARTHLQNADAARAFPQRREAIEKVALQLDQAIGKIELLPRLAVGMSVDRNLVVEDIIKPLQQALNTAQNQLVQ